MRRREVRRVRGVLGVVVSVAAGLGAIACGPGASGPGELEPRDHRYRALLRARPRLELRFEPRDGWHIEPEAVAVLRLEASEGFALDPPELTGEQALEHSEQALAFGLSLARVASGDDPEAELRGSVKFGVCRDDSSVCEIVRRDLTLRAPAGS